MRLTRRAIRPYRPGMLGYHRPMTDAPADSHRTDTAPTRRASQASWPARPRWAMVDGERGPAALPRLPDRRHRRPRHLQRRREPALDRRLGSAAPARDRRPCRREVLTVLRALPPTTKPMDALRTAVSAWGRHRTVVAADRRAGPRAHLHLALDARRVRPPPPGPRARSSPTRRSTSSRASSTSSTGRARTRHGEGARRLLHGRRRAQLQRLDLHGPGHHLDPLGPRVGGRRGDRHDEGPAPRRRPDRGRRPARPDRLARARRGVAERRARPQGAADGLRPPRLPRLRPARRRAAQGRRVDAEPARLAPDSPSRSRTSRCGSWPSGTPSGRSRPTSSTTRRPCCWASA